MEGWHNRLRLLVMGTVPAGWSRDIIRISRVIAIGRMLISLIVAVTVAQLAVIEDSESLHDLKRFGFAFAVPSRTHAGEHFPEYRRHRTPSAGDRYGEQAR